MNNPPVLFFCISLIVRDCEHKMKLVKQGNKIRVTNEGKMKNGDIFYKTNNDPLPIVVGKNQIFPVLEEELIGMKIGETQTHTLAPKDAFGEHDEHLLMSISKESIDSDVHTVVGNTIVIEASEGEKFTGPIVDGTDDKVTVDFNHPYAGKEIVVTCTICSIENQNPEMS